MQGFSWQSDPMEFTANQTTKQYRDDLDRLMKALVYERHHADRRHGSHWAVSDDNPLRLAWNMHLSVLLLYTGTIYPAKLAFIDFGIPARDVPRWYGVLELYLIDASFCFDLFANFFFTYRDAHGRQIYDLRKIAARYLRGCFALDLIACIPAPVFNLLACGMVACSSSSLNQMVRLSRARRVHRIVGVSRLLRLTKVPVVFSCARVWRQARNSSFMHVARPLVGLLCVVHLVGCGWWMCAGFPRNADDTWIARRPFRDTTLLEASESGQVGPAVQWLTSVYFTLAVFTSVGFGDIFASTSPEMVYASFTMILGCIVNGIVLSSLISWIVSDNEEQRLLAEQKREIRNFGKHMHVADALTEVMTNWATTTKMDHSNYNREQIKHLLTSGTLPREFMLILPHALFSGRLTRNKFVSEMLLAYPLESPGNAAQLPVLLAIASTNLFYVKDQLVYSFQDHAWSIYLTLKGTFSYLATCRTRDLGDDGISKSNGSEEHRTSSSKHLLRRVKPSSNPSRVAPYQTFGWGNYFGDIEIFLRSMPRCSSARCETEKGSLLMLHKKDMFALVEEYPLLIAHWRAAALVREKRRASLYKRRRFLRNAEELAVHIVQRHWRDIVLKRSTPLAPKRALASEDKARLVERLAAGSTRRSQRIAPTAEVVPSYARNLQMSVDEVRSEIGDLREEFRTTFMSEMQGIKEALTSVTGTRTVPI